MKIALRMPLGPTMPELIEIAQRGEAAGCDSVWIGDHLLWPVEIDSRYPYHETGKARLAPDTSFFDCFVLLDQLGAATSRIRLATGVYILPLRPALLTARAAASVDASTGGRLILGVGSGWMREEFEAAGADFDQRGPITDEYIAVLRATWGASPTAFSGRFVSFPESHFQPQPAQGGGLPIHVGGETPPAMRRAATLGDGWIAMSQTPEAAVAAMADLQQRREAAGRADLPFEITMRIPWPTTPEHLREFAAIGVDRVLFSPWGPARSDYAWGDDLVALEELLAGLPRDGDELHITAD